MGGCTAIPTRRRGVRLRKPLYAIKHVVSPRLRRKSCIGVQGGEYRDHPALMDTLEACRARDNREDAHHRIKEETYIGRLMVLFVIDGYSLWHVGHVEDLVGEAINASVITNPLATMNHVWENKVVFKAYDPDDKSMGFHLGRMNKVGLDGNGSEYLPREEMMDHYRPGGRKRSHGGNGGGSAMG